MRTADSTELVSQFAVAILWGFVHLFVVWKHKFKFMFSYLILKCFILNNKVYLASFIVGWPCEFCENLKNDYIGSEVSSYETTIIPEKNSYHFLPLTIFCVHRKVEINFRRQLYHTVCTMKSKLISHLSGCNWVLVLL